MQTRFLSLLITLVFALLSVALSKGQGAPVFQLEKEIPLADVEGRIDHFSANVAGQRLFVAALGNGSVEVLDVREGKRTAEIRGLKEPQGVFYDPKACRLYVATGGDGKLHIYDGKSLREQATLEFGDDADNIRQDPQTGDLWVGYGNAGLGIVNSSGQNVGSVALGTHPESFQFEKNGDRVYVNVPKQFGVAVIDRKKRAAVAKWGLGGSSANYPMAFDDTDKRLFVGCRFPARLINFGYNFGANCRNLAHGWRR
jgi:DNA-binding beta-propeller fold protein YncE